MSAQQTMAELPEATKPRRKSSCLLPVAFVAIVVIILGACTYAFRDAIFNTGKPDEAAVKDSTASATETLLAQYDTLSLLNDRLDAYDIASRPTDSKEVQRLKYDRCDLAIRCKAETKAIEYLVSRYNALQDKELSLGAHLRTATNDADILHTEQEVNHVKSELIAVESQLSIHVTNLSTLHKQIDNVNNKLADIQGN